MSESSDPSGAEVRRRAGLPGFDEIAARRDLWSTLAAHRRAVGVSQDAIARRMGTTQSSIARLEAGGTDARLSTLQRYAAALDAGVSVGFAADGRVGVEVLATPARPDRPTRPDQTRPDPTGPDQTRP